MRALTVTALVIWAALLATPAAASPCAGSGYPAAGFDTFASSATVGVDADPGCGAPTILSAQGETTIKRGDPDDPGDGRCQIGTEMVSLGLSGAGPIGIRETIGGSDPNNAADPPCTIGGASLDGGPGCSPGLVRQQTAGVDFPADSFFDVYVEVDMDGQTIFNRDPIHVQSVIGALPPLGGVFAAPAGCVPLYASTDPFGAPVLYLASVSHKVGCGNGVVDPGEDCDGDACCTADCTIASASTICRYAVDQCDADDTCDGVSAACPADVLQPDGTPCVDADQCTGPDTCQSGVCTSGPVVGDGTPCNDGNQCTDPDTCQAGVCGGTVVADGTPCNDFHICSGPDTCTAGTCGGPHIPGCSALGGDDTGFVPPDKATAKCEDGVAKMIATLTNSVIKCNIKDSDDQFKHSGSGAFDGAACQAVAAVKYDTKVGGLTGCPACLDRNAVRDLTVTLVNLNGGVVFCDDTSGTAEDLPAAGFVPPNKGVQKCEDTTAKNASKLVGYVVKCHVKAADSFLRGRTFDEEACEATAKLKYDAAAAKLVAYCPPCLAPGAQSAVRDLVEDLLDSNNGMTYCSSPSGAFLD